jgi:alpha-ketoglutarate-dependent taurine dioxygenase
MNAVHPVDSPAGFELHPLEPFGVVVTWHTPTSLAEIPTPWLEELVAAHRVAVLRQLGPPLEAKALEAYARRMGELLRWPFGYVLELQVSETPRNYLFTRDHVEFHWDGAFAEAEPRYLLFQCREAPAEGGESLYSDTTRAWARSSDAVRRWLRGCVCRYRQERNAHYGGDITVPVVAEDAVTGEVVLRYAEPVKGIGGTVPELLGPDGAIDLDGSTRLAAHLREALYHPEVCLTHRWESGDVVMVDNRRLLHGRRAFGARCQRHLQRVHIL